MIRAVFMGTPVAAVPILSALRGVADVALVVTRPDRARGRSSRLVPPPAKEAALEAGLAIVQPSSGTELFEAVAAVEPDVAVVAAYGRIIRPDLLAVPRHGFINVHYSLLPRWRGASPVVRAILAGDETTGVSLMVMDEGLDTGPVFASEAVAILGDDTTGVLTGRIAEVAGRLLAAELPPYLEGRLTPVPQDDSQATAAAKVTTEEAHVDPTRHSAVSIVRAVRAFNPRPGAWSIVDGHRLKIWRAIEAPSDSEVGVARLEEGSVVLGTRDGAVELLEVQPAGKPSMEAGAWMNGRRGVAAAFS